MNPRWKKWGVAAAIFVGIYFLLYSSDAVAFKLAGKIDQALWPYGQFLGKLRHQTGRFLDDLNPFRSSDRIRKSLESYEFTLSPKDIRYFFSSPEKKGEITWAKPLEDSRAVELRHEGRVYEASLKLHGDTAEHWRSRKKSFQVRLKEKKLRGGDRFLLILPHLRQYLMPLFASRLAEKIELPVVDNGFASVTMNDIFQGIYYREERVDDAFLKRKGISGVLVELSDNWVEDRAMAGGNPAKYYGGISVNDHHDTPFNLEVANVKPIASPYGPEVMKKVDDLFEAVERKDVETFEGLMDIPRVGAIDAWRTLLGDRHTLLGDNARMVYDLSNGRFFFIPRSEGAYGDLLYEGGSFERWLNSKKRIVPFWEMLARSEKIRAVRNRWIHYFVTHEKEILAVYDELQKKYEPILAQDDTLPVSSRELHHRLVGDREVLRSNLTKLKAQFDYHKMYVSAIVEGNQVHLTLIPDTSMQSLAVNRLKFIFRKDARPQGNAKIHSGPFSVTADPASDLKGLLEGKEFGFSLNESLNPEPREYKFQVVFDGLQEVGLAGIDLGVFAVVDGSILPKEDIYASIASSDGLLAARAAS